MPHPAPHTQTHTNTYSIPRPPPKRRARRCARARRARKIRPARLPSRPSPDGLCSSAHPLPGARPASPCQPACHPACHPHPALHRPAPPTPSIGGAPPRWRRRRYAKKAHAPGATRARGRHDPPPAPRARDSRAPTTSPLLPLPATQPHPPPTDARQPRRHRWWEAARSAQRASRSAQRVRQCARFRDARAPPTHLGRTACRVGGGETVTRTPCVRVCVGGPWLGLPTPLFHQHPCSCQIQLFEFHEPPNRSSQGNRV